MAGAEHAKELSTTNQTVARGLFALARIFFQGDDKEVQE